MYAVSYVFQRFQPGWNHSKAFHAIQCQNVGYIIDIWGILGHYLVFCYESNWESSVKALVVCCATYCGSGNIASRPIPVPRIQHLRYTVRRITLKQLIETGNVQVLLRNFAFFLSSGGYCWYWNNKNNFPNKRWTFLINLNEHLWSAKKRGVSLKKSNSNSYALCINLPNLSMYIPLGSTETWRLA